MRNYAVVTLVIAIALLLNQSACRTSKEGESLNKEQSDRALALLNGYCFSCHHPDMNTGSRLAPPMFMVRQHYYTEGEPRDQFIKRIVSYASNPTQEASIMPGAVRNFGLMPKQTFRSEDLQLMAVYLYENDVATNGWYRKWEKFKKNPTVIALPTNYLDRGMDIANGTKGALGKNLLAAISEGGAAHAVDFCNTRAIPLTDSMAMHYGATIRRVTDQARNQANQANESELAYIAEAKAALARGEKPAPKLTDAGTKMIGYYPIETNKMCLQCHGTNETILPETRETILRHYPNDRATGYGENQLRGVFVVEMDKK